MCGEEEEEGGLVGVFFVVCLFVCLLFVCFFEPSISFSEFIREGTINTIVRRVSIN